MSLVKFSKFGDFKISVSPLDAVYTFNSQAGYGLCPWKTFNDMEAIVGTDLSPLVINAPLNQSVKVATMTNGSYLNLKVISKDTEWTDFGSDYAWKWKTYGGRLEIYDKNNNLIFSHGQASTNNFFYAEFYIKSTGEIKRGKMLLFMAEDAENKVAYAKIYSEGISSTKGTVPNILRSDFIVNSNASLYNAIHGYITEYDPDPWASGGYGDIGGGDGQLDLSSDIISLPDFPRSVVSTGFVQIYTPTLKQINELSDYMWGDSFLSNVLKLWNDPMDIIINLSQIPFNVPMAGTQKVTAGNVITTVDMNYPESQYYEVDCGYIDIKHFYDAYIDYEPYTTCEIFLPYIGTELLSMDDIMGKRLAVKYRVDIVTGACVAFILANDVILYTFTGACSINIPVSGQTFTGVANALISTVTAGAVAKGESVTSKGKPIPSSKPGAVASSLASNVMSCKPTINRSGSITSNVGVLGTQKPYLIFTVPRSCLPKGQNKYLGYPAFMTSKVSELKGYTEIESIRLNNMSCTDAEKNEIEAILKEGAIL